MRENKFRIWDKVANKWLDYEEIYFDQEGEVYLIEERTWAYQSYMHKENRTENVEVVRFTGLKDKNGKEIYEGDILKVTTVRGDTRWQMEVDFENGCFSLKEGPELWKLKYDYPNHEVIGNIYENPELLEESK